MRVPRTETMEDMAVTLRSAQSPQPMAAEVVVVVEVLLYRLLAVLEVAKDQKGVQLSHQASTVLAGAVMVHLRQGLILLAAEVVVVGAPLYTEGLMVCMQLMVVSVVLVLAV